MRKKTPISNSLFYWSFLLLFFFCSINVSRVAFYSHADSFRKNLAAYDNKKSSGENENPFSKIYFLDNEENDDDDVIHPLTSPELCSTFNFISYGFSDKVLFVTADSPPVAKSVPLHVFIRKFLV